MIIVFCVSLTKNLLELVAGDHTFSSSSRLGGRLWPSPSTSLSPLSTEQSVTAAGTHEEEAP
jgi:hypothetical protein